MNEKSIMPRAMKRKKFYCSCCGEKLIPYPKTRIIKRGDPDYKKHRNIGFGRRLIGDIELTEYDFSAYPAKSLCHMTSNASLRKFKNMLAHISSRKTT